MAKDNDDDTAKILTEWRDAWRGFYQGPVLGEEAPTITDSFGLYPRDCTHEYVTYTGLTETYEYCKVCDKKKEDENA